MFPLQPGDELVFGRTPNIISQSDKIQDNLLPDHDNLLSDHDDLIVDHAILESNIINFSTSSNNNKQLGQKQHGFPERERLLTAKDDCSIVKRVMHRDVERKRRQEMSKLYASLRSLLPHYHIKGKGSVCDHMMEAVNYIKHMRKNIQELRIRRDKLKKLSNLSATKGASSNGIIRENLPNCVTVNPVRDGTEILIKNSEFRLSRVLAELLKRQLNVVNCVSTKTKGRFLHKIQAEATDITALNPSVLQERLSRAVN